MVWRNVCGKACQGTGQHRKLRDDGFSLFCSLDPGVCSGWRETHCSLTGACGPGARAPGGEGRCTHRAGLSVRRHDLALRSRGAHPPQSKQPGGRAEDNRPRCPQGRAGPPPAGRCSGSPGLGCISQGSTQPQCLGSSFFWEALPPSLHHEGWELSARRPPSLLSWWASDGGACWDVLDPRQAALLPDPVQGWDCSRPGRTPESPGSFHELRCPRPPGPHPRHS